MFGFSNYSAKSTMIMKYYGHSKKLVVEKMKDETGDLLIEKFFGLKSKMYSSLVDNKRT